MLSNVLKAIPAIPEFVLSTSALIALISGTFKSKRTTSKTFAIIGLSLVLLCVLLALSTKTEQYCWSGLFVHNQFLNYAKIILYSVSSLALLVLFSFLDEYKIKQYEWLIIATFVVIGGSVSLSSNHFLTLFIGLELSHLSQYLLVAINRDNLASSEAAVKFFTIGAISTSLTLFGMSLIYGFTGTNFFNSVYYFFQTNVGNFEHAGAIIGALFILIGLCFKLPVAPFHTWAPDVYQASSFPIVLFLGTIPKIIITFVLLHLLSHPFYGIFNYWRYLFVGLSVLSMIWGSLAALRQTNLKRMFAYSTVSNMGFLLMGPAMGGAFGIESLISYIIIYVLNMIGALTLLAVFERNYKQINEIKDLSGVMQHSPLLGSLFCLFILSLAGIPPLPGFFAKAYILLGVIGKSAYLLGLIAVLTSIISAAYYLNVLRYFVLQQVDLKTNNFNDSKKYIVKTLTVLIGLILVLIIAASPYFLETCRLMAASALFE